jgi:hypothetical protein
MSTQIPAEMSMVVLFIIAKPYKQQRYPSVNKWINNLWTNETMTYYSALKMNDLLNHEKT